MKVTTIGIDLAKNVFQLHGVDSAGQVLIRRALKRARFLGFMNRLKPCVVAMEACSGAHHWARQLEQMGHDVRLIAPQYVKPYVKGDKHDAADAEAICEAAQRPNMRFVGIKTLEQQAVLCLHRARERLVALRTGQANQIRGLLSEFGLVMPRGMNQVRKRTVTLIEHDSLPISVARLCEQLLQILAHLDEQIKQLERQIVHWHRHNEQSSRLAELPGIGPISASAIVASMGDARQFSRASQASAWVGVVPRQHSSGGKQQMLGISKRGDTYLRKLLVLGAQSVLQKARRQPHQHQWLHRLMQRRGNNVAALAVANKNMRIAWALLAHGRRYQANYGGPDQAAVAG